MRPHVVAIFGAVILLAGCAGQPQVADTAVWPQPGPVGINPDIYAIQQAQYGFASPARTRNAPAQAALSVASLDYAAGEVNTAPYWQFMNPLTKVQMLQARQEVRQTLGIPPNAPSQAVVNGMLSASNALAAGNRQAAEQILQPPVFGRGPQATLALLDDMPYQPIANVATMHAGSQLTPSDGSTWDR